MIDADDYRNSQTLFMNNPRRPALTLEVDCIKTPSEELAKAIQLTPVADERGWFSIQLTTTVRLWKFPRDPFVEYGREDERWARALGFGREVECPLRMEFVRAKIVRKDGAMLIQAEPPKIDFNYPGVTL